jgi:hypothetical protein
MWWMFYFPVDTHLAESLTAVWTMVGAFAQIGISGGVPLSLYLYAKQERKDRARLEREESVVNKRKSAEDRAARKKFREEERDKFYAQLDEIYLKIQRTIIDYPHLGLSNVERSEYEAVQYNSFAFMMWNFIESIHDYCLDNSRLKKTWHCILVSEAKGHREWFDNHVNRGRFKDEFVAYMIRESLVSP